MNFRTLKCSLPAYIIPTKPQYVKFSSFLCEVDHPCYLYNIEFSAQIKDHLVGVKKIQHCTVMTGTNGLTTNGLTDLP
uniref:Uncharacterized protein n=1 Tax=Arundo donax TaxID=35708 RepID=A0A0A9GKS3_ARUDO